MKDKIYNLYMKVKHITKMIKTISIIKFVKYNYLSKNVKRENGAHIYPTKGSIIEFSKGSKLHIKGNLYLGNNILKGSKAETLIRLRRNALFTINGDLRIYYEVSIDVFDNGKLDIGSGEINCYSVIMCNKSISIGKNVLIARSVFIYDSDFHELYDEYTQTVLPLSEDVIIGDDVWLCIKSTILKGSIIEDGAIVPANKKIQGRVKQSSIKRL